MPAASPTPTCGFGVEPHCVAMMITSAAVAKMDR